MWARSARVALAPERPESEVVTLTPRSASLAPTADPISPAAMIATVYAMSLILEVVHR